MSIKEAGGGGEVCIGVREGHVQSCQCCGVEGWRGASCGESDQGSFLLTHLLPAGAVQIIEHPQHFLAVWPWTNYPLLLCLILCLLNGGYNTAPKSKKYWEPKPFLIYLEAKLDLNWCKPFYNLYLDLFWLFICFIEGTVLSLYELIHILLENYVIKIACMHCCAQI